MYCKKCNTEKDSMDMNSFDLCKECWLEEYNRVEREAWRLRKEKYPESKGHKST